MKTVQMTLDEDLVEEVDRAVHSMGTNRSAFTRDALKEALARLRERELEKQHLAGYERHPVREGEFDVREDEQAWVD